MRYALIIAGGSGTRLWPMSTKKIPKQLIPLFDGRSLLQISMDRLAGLIPDDRVYVCAGDATRDVMLESLPALAPPRFIGEPMGRDTLNAVALGTAVIAQRDPDATVAVFTADHLIEPVDEFQQIVRRGYDLAEAGCDGLPTLMTFGIRPSHASDAYGYLQLGRAIGDGGFIVERFTEKPDAAEARLFLEAGPEKYLWNSGMFVWRAAALLDCVARYEPENHGPIMRVAEAWDTPKRDDLLSSLYPKLKKISVDYAVMQPASKDHAVRVGTVPMPLNWLDVGSWPSFAAARTPDAEGNVSTGCDTVHLDSHGTVAVSSDPGHLVATIGCDDLIVIHTPRTTLVCRGDQAERIKQLHATVAERFTEHV